MAIVQKIRDLFTQVEIEVDEDIVPAPPTTYRVRPLTEDQIREVMLLNLRCFRKGENYNKYTFRYLLNEPAVLSYRAVTPEDRMVGFIFIIAKKEGIAHITTIGVAPEHRKRGIGRMMLEHAEDALAAKNIHSIVLEVRVSNSTAQKLYTDTGFVIMQRLRGYYRNGEDAYLMSKVVPRDIPPERKFVR
jgi:ribosomal-protein-alanine N-acetyltransferase